MCVVTIRVPASVDSLPRCGAVCPSRVRCESDVGGGGGGVHRAFDVAIVDVRSGSDA